MAALCHCEYCAPRAASAKAEVPRIPVLPRENLALDPDGAKSGLQRLSNPPFIVGPKADPGKNR